MAARVFLGLSALLWLPYGVFCFVEPSALAGSAWVAANAPTGVVELRAMYGGLQIALGALAGMAVWRPALVRPALIALAFLCSGLFSARLLGAGLSRDLSSYTAMALGFELVSAALALWLLSRIAGQGTD
jgi:hypothetical protein